MAICCCSSEELTSNSAMNVNHDWQTQIYVRGVDVKIKAVFIVDRTFCKQFEVIIIQIIERCKASHLQTDVSMRFSRLNVWFPFLWRLWGFKSQLSDRWSGKRNAKKLANGFERARGIRMRCHETFNASVVGGHYN